MERDMVGGMKWMGRREGAVVHAMGIFGGERWVFGLFAAGLQDYNCSDSTTATLFNIVHYFPRLKVRVPHGGQVRSMLESWYCNNQYNRLSLVYKPTLSLEKMTPLSLVYRVGLVQPGMLDMVLLKEWPLTVREGLPCDYNSRPASASYAHDERGYTYRWMSGHELGNADFLYLFHSRPSSTVSRYPNFREANVQFNRRFRTETSIRHHH